MSIIPTGKEFVAELRFHEKPSPEQLEKPGTTVKVHYADGDGDVFKDVTAIKNTGGELVITQVLKREGRWATDSNGAPKVLEEIIETRVQLPVRNYSILRQG